MKNKLSLENLSTDLVFDRSLMHLVKMVLMILMMVVEVMLVMKDKCKHPKQMIKLILNKNKFYE